MLTRYPRPKTNVCLQQGDMRRHPIPWLANSSSESVFQGREFPHLVVRILYMRLVD